MITGFQAQGEVDDAGTGAAPTGASTRFAGLITFNLPSLEAGTIDATELDQDDGGGTPAPDPYEREAPSGLIKIGKTKCEMKYTKANYQRLQSLVKRSVAGVPYTVILKTPDDLSTPGTPVKLTTTLKAFFTKLDELKFEKDKPATIPFEITVQKKPTYA